MCYLGIKQFISVLFLSVMKAKCQESLCFQEAPLAMPTIALRTVYSDGVFEGRLQNFVFSSSDVELPLNATFVVIKVHKGKTLNESESVVVEIMQIHGAQNASCLVPKFDDAYVVFVNQSAALLNRSYLSSGHIMPATDQIVQQVKDYACAECGLPVKVRLPTRVKVQEGAKVKLRCRTKGMLKPKIYWSKDGQALVFEGHIKLVDRLGSVLRIKNVHSNDGGIYQCLASTAITNSTLASTKLVVIKAKFPTSIHGELCHDQDYCLNNGRCYFMKTLGKKYCVCAKGFTGDHCKFRSEAVFVNKVGSLAGIPLLEHVNVKTFVVCVVVIGAVLIAAVVILSFCVVRQCSVRKKLSKPAKEKLLNEQLPVLPDGHQTVVNVNRLSCVLNQQSASDFDGMRPSATLCFPGNPSSLDRVREEEPAVTSNTNSGTTHPNWSGSRPCATRLPASVRDQKRLNRLSAASDDVTSRCQSWISGNRLSMTSDRLSFSGAQHSGEKPPGRPFQNSKSNIGAVRSSAAAHAHEKERLTAISTSPESDSEPLPNLPDLPESVGSTGTPYCLPPGNHDAGDFLETEASVETLEKDVHQSDMEVNFESEADILGMEMSGDELNERTRRGTSRNFSEMSIPTNENQSLVTTDSEDSTLSITEEQALLRRLSEYPFINTNVFNHVENNHESGSDLSWDESADIPSFANPSLMYSGHS